MALSHSIFGVQTCKGWKIDDWLPFLDFMDGPSDIERAGFFGKLQFLCCQISTLLRQPITTKLDNRCNSFFKSWQSVFNFLSAFFAAKFQSCQGSLWQRLIIGAIFFLNLAVIFVKKCGGELKNWKPTAKIWTNIALIIKLCHRLPWQGWNLAAKFGRGLPKSALTGWRLAAKKWENGARICSEHPVLV